MLRPSLWQARRASLRTPAPTSFAFHGLPFLRGGVDAAGNPPRAGSKRSTELLAQASDLTKEIKAALRSMGSRDFLSITPKAEDLTLVYRWIERFGVPHYYCQVFFDRAVLLSFEDILTVLCAPEREGIDYFIEADEKNQRKVVFKINVALGQEVMSDVKIPEHQSAMKERLCCTNLNLCEMPPTPDAAMPWPAGASWLGARAE